MRSQPLPRLPSYSNQYPQPYNSGDPKITAHPASQAYNQQGYPQQQQGYAPAATAGLPAAAAAGVPAAATRLPGSSIPLSTQPTTNGQLRLRTMRLRPGPADRTGPAPAAPVRSARSSREGYEWTPGYWAYGPTGYNWVPGAWVEPPYQGALWTPGYWGDGDGGYFWNAGYWGTTIGFYGGINYGFGYFGTGFYGGYWNGGRFFYNRAYWNVGRYGRYRLQPALPRRTGGVHPGGRSFAHGNQSRHGFRGGAYNQRGFAQAAWRQPGNGFTAGARL